MMRNLRLAFRTLFKAPFITAVAILSLALGIGANAAIFSLFDQVLLRPLPVHEPERLVNLTAAGPKMGSTSSGQPGGPEAVFSYPLFRDLASAETGFTDIAAHRVIGANLSYEGQTSSGQALLVSGSYFPLLGLKPVLGRLLGPTDDEAVGAHPVAVLSHSYWETHLGADPGVLNRTIVVNGVPLTIIGVAPRGFDGTTLGTRPRVFVPLTMAGQISWWTDPFEDRLTHWLYLFARLKPGVTAEQAATAVNAVFRPIITDVEAPLQSGMSEQMLAQFRARKVRLEPGQRGQSTLHDETRTPLTLLLVITGVVLLIACANIANLLLARGANRGMEMAVRLSLGASRRHVLVQLLTESCVLAVMGGIASLVVVDWTLTLVGSILPPEAATVLQLELNPSVFVFTAALSLGTGLLFGLFPALHSTRSDLVTTIRANAGNLAGARSATRFRTGLVTAQIALSMTLLISAGLFLRSLVNVSRADLGLQAERVVTFGISPELNGYEPARSRNLFRRVEEELAALPGVSGVAASMVPLLSGDSWGSNVSVEGFDRGPDVDDGANYNKVGPGFFRLLGIPLVAGREFTAGDEAGAPKVAVVNQAFARKFHLGDDPVGKYMAIGSTDELDIQIVGLVPDTKYADIKAQAPPLFYTPYRQDEDLGAIYFYVRTAGDPAQVMRAVPELIARIDPNLPVENLKTLPQVVRERITLDRMVSVLSVAFAALATLLAAVGLYGVLAYTVAQRTREIGVRMALGADGRKVRAMVLGQVGRMMLVGGVIGIIAALGLGRAASSLLFGVDGSDPAVVAGAAVVLALVALGAGYIPALRASRVDPVRALRYE